MFTNRLFLTLLCGTALSVGAVKGGQAAEENQVEQKPQVAMVTRIMAMPSAMAESFMTLAGFQMNMADQDSPAFDVAFLNERQLKGWLEMFQRDPLFNLMQAPKITTFSGQQGEIKIGEEMTVPIIPSPTTGGAAVSGQEKTFVGVHGKLLPVVSADGKFTRLQLDWRFVSLNREDDTQRLERVSLKSTVVIPSHGTAVYRVYTKPCVRIETFGPPILSKIPYANRLFTNCGYKNDEDVYFLMITTQIVANDHNSVSSDGGRE